MEADKIVSYLNNVLTTPLSLSLIMNFLFEQYYGAAFYKKEKQRGYIFIKMIQLLISIGLIYYFDYDNLITLSVQVIILHFVCIKDATSKRPGAVSMIYTARLIFEHANQTGLLEGTVFDLL